MQVSKISPTIFNTIQAKRTVSFQGLSIFSNRSDKALEQSKQTVFAKHLFPQKETAAHFLSKKGKVTKKDYDSFIKDNPYLQETARFKLECSRNQFFTPCEEMVECSEKVKSYFDTKYPNGYRIISIGTSPAVLSKAMELMGAEVVYLPVSGIDRQLYDIGEDDTVSLRNTQILMNYLKSKGVGNPDDNKTNIFIDYCMSGQTIDFITQTANSSLNIPPEKSEKYNISDLLYQLCDERKVNHINTDMSFQSMENIANVPHFYLNDRNNRFMLSDAVCSGKKEEQEIFQEFENFSKPLARFYEICMIDEMYKKGIFKVH